MPSITGVLREARAEVIPQVPELVPYLYDDETVVLRALQNQVGNAGVDVDSVSPLDWNKLERHTIAGYAIQVHRDLTVIGSGPETRFMNFHRQDHDPRIDKARQLRFDIDHNMIIAGVETSNNLYAKGLWVPMADRIATLGATAIDKTPKGPRNIFYRESFRHPMIPAEGVNMDRAVQNGALGSVVEPYVRFIRRKVRDPESRKQASHDLAHMASGKASQHTVPFLFEAAGLKFHLYKGDVYRKEDGAYAIRRKLIKRRRYMKYLPNVTLKCPAQAVKANPNGDGSGSINETYVQSLVHAALNEAPEYGCFD
jgi:hypothetical protein